jgi:hypothetical protein
MRSGKASANEVLERWALICYLLPLMARTRSAGPSRTWGSSLSPHCPGQRHHPVQHSTRLCTTTTPTTPTTLLNTS